MAYSSTSFIYKNDYLSSTSDTTYTFSSLDMDTPRATRAIVVRVQASATGTALADPIDVTVGGVSLTRMTSVMDSYWHLYQGLFVGPIPTGTTADIVATFGQAQDGCGIAYAIISPLDWYPTNADSALGSFGANSLPISVPTVPGGLCIMFMTKAGSGGDQTPGWNNYTNPINLIDSGASFRNWKFYTSYPSTTNTYTFTAYTTGANSTLMVSTLSFGEDYTLQDTLSDAVGVSAASLGSTSGGALASDVLRFDLANEQLSLVTVRSGVSTDAINVSSGLVQAFRPGALVWDVLQAQEAYAAGGIYPRTATEIARLTDALGTAYPRTLADTVTMSSALAVVRGTLVLEALGLSEALAGHGNYGLTVLERLRASDVAQAFFGRAVVDAVGVAGELLPVKRMAPTVSDVLDISGSLAPRLVLRATVAETVGIDDIDVLQMLFSPVVAEGIEITGAFVSPSGSVTTWAVNTNTGAVTEYTNYDFNSFAQLGRRYLGASSTGLYVLDGDTDAGTSIISKLKSGLIQFTGSRFTGFQAAYIGMRGGGDVLLKLVTGDGLERVYRVTTNDMRTTKVLMGKGIRARYFSFELETTGQDFDLDTVEFAPIMAQRRV